MSKRKNIPKKLFFKNLVFPITFSSLLLLITCYLLLLAPIPFFQLLRSQYSLSAGDRYYGRVRLWYYYAQAGDWTHAVFLESGIDPDDISVYRLANYPLELKKRLNSLVVKSPRSPDDLIELAKIQASLNKFNDAITSITQANSQDPIRSDLEKIYYQILP
jgi:hypothetical protein